VIRKGPGGSREVWFEGHWVPEDSLNLDELRRAQAAPPPDEMSEPVRRKSKGPTKRQKEVWDAVAKHGTQAAAAKALGCNQSTIQGGLKGYMKAMGIEGDMPGYSQPGKASVPKRKRPRDTATDAADLDRPLSEPSADHASDMHPPVDAETAGEAWEEWLVDAKRQKPTTIGHADYELRITTAGTDPFKAGYAQGFAVAVLRVLATFELLPSRMADMASDAADGLMS